MTSKLKDSEEAVATRSENAPTTIYSPLTDAIEFDDRLELRLDVPGVTADAIDVKFEDNTLSIRAIREDGPRQGLLHGEFGGAQFRRAFTVPRGLDGSRIEAALKHGVLTLTLPKSQEAQPRRIEVK